MWMLLRLVLQSMSVSKEIHHIVNWSAQLGAVIYISVAPRYPYTGSSIAASEMDWASGFNRIYRVGHYECKDPDSSRSVQGVVGAAAHYPKPT